MKEIIYIQAGSISNYVGTHFWNAQQSYFTYGEDEEVLIDHDISFREGISPKGEPTYCPRLLQFDRKANFGSLSSNRGFYAEDETEGTASLWDGAVDEIRQDRVPDNTYQLQLDEEVEEDPAFPEAEESQPVPPLKRSDVRYWSDYNRVYYLPRSVHKLPDPADWGTADGDWQGGKDAFSRYNSDNALMDDSFRLFVEECDTFQGLQLCIDNATFGSFADSLMTAFRDDFPKHPTMTFAVLSDSVPGDIDVDDMHAIRKALNDALCLRGSNEFSTMTIPLWSPSVWTSGPWSAELSVDLQSPYETSAILSAHVETATLPLRVKTRELLGDFCDQLNVNGVTPFAELSGAFPASSAKTLDSRTYHFALMQPEPGGRSGPQLPRRNVTRGWTELARRQFDDLNAVSASRAIVRSLHARDEYPLPSSFPSFFRAQHLSAEARRTPRGILARPRSVPMVSTLASGRASPRLLAQHGDFVRDCIQRKVDWSMLGMDEDEARELRDSLWALRDNFGDVLDSSDHGSEGLGEDEEA
ncbi:tubulin nucleotide-binding domain-like protein [Gloeopeniophorella convolvens]|nr:tubulin nucleotide-binding domain-like protein [Gloeopeniophorella convolvens]